ncbi:MAG: bacillithiol system redox-active protein YtxJ [Chitinophagia bacterium]|nr:bacillithiol system redox-active protein YtxJ [Chitinophagia bacterium]
MFWNQLTTEAQLAGIVKTSELQPVLIFKHSTRCSISSAALDRVERKWNDAVDTAKVQPWYLDLIAYRDISNKIASEFNVEHQSPQVLIIVNGQCVYSATHYDINYLDILEAAEAAK